MTHDKFVVMMFISQCWCVVGVGAAGGQAGCIVSGCVLTNESVM